LLAAGRGNCNSHDREHNKEGVEVKALQTTAADNREPSSRGEPITLLRRSKLGRGRRKWHVLGFCVPYNEINKVIKVIFNHVGWV